MDAKKRVTQAERLIKYLEDGRWISGLDIVDDLAILSYTRRLTDLRRKGFIIEKRYNIRGYYQYRLVRP